MPRRLVDLPPHNLRYRLSARISRLKAVPMIYPVLSLLPAPEDRPSIQLAIEIDESLLEPLEHTSDLLQLEQVVLDLTRDGLDCAPQLELLLRLPPVGPRLRGGELVLVDQVTPLGVEGRDIRDDPLHEREGAVGFGEGEMLAAHGTNVTTGNATTRRTDAQRKTVGVNGATCSLDLFTTVRLHV